MLTHFSIIKTIGTLTAITIAVLHQLPADNVCSIINGLFHPTIRIVRYYTVDLICSIDDTLVG